ncbi:MAG: FAD-binding oxidoreductase [Anaerolineae bacterium]|nr:FAD-binding oxidoreductase [Anaerolineae bacterium]
MTEYDNLKMLPLWTDQFPRPKDLPVGELPEKADVVIVGSGYTGLNAALALAEAGASVVVVEQNVIGWGASSRNGSMLTSGLKAKSKIIKKRYGAALADHFWRWSVDAIGYVGETVRKNKIDCDYKNVGNLYLASKASHAENVKAHGEYLNKEFGYATTRWIPKEEIHSEIGSDEFHGGLLDTTACRLQPAKYVFGLARAAAQKGAVLVENARVTGISGKRGGLKVTTEKGQISAKEVLMATGGYTTNLVPKVRWGIFPVGSYIIATEPLPDDLRRSLSPNDRVFYDSNIFLNYFTMTAEGRFMLGGRANLSPNLDLRKSAAILHGRMLQIFPQLKGIPLTHSWSGKLGISFDQMPHVGLANGVHYAYGYSGHGVSIASYLGNEVGAMMAGSGARSKYMDIKHPRTIFSSLDPLYLPFVSAYFKLLDKMS